MNTKPTLAVYVATLLAAFNFHLAPAFAQGTAFTYQGRLDEGVNPAGGIYDLRFTIYDLASAGSVVGEPVTNSLTSVSNGLFTVTLDFGDQFPGAGRWLEIGVRTNGGGAFVTLSPRQPFTATPYAVRAATAQSATTAAVASSVAAASITGTIGVAQLPPTVVTNGASGVSFTGTFRGDAGGLSNLNSESLTGLLSVVNGLVNLSHGNNPAFSGSQGVTVSGNYAYLANGSDGLRVYDISNPANPINVGHTNNGAEALGIAVSGNYAYLANNADGLRVYDISNPANPINVGHIDNGGFAKRVAVSGNYAYLANQADGLRVYDISNPAHPINVGHIDNGGSAWDVAVLGSYAYLANYEDGLRVYDISNPANPINVGHINNRNFTNDAAAHGIAVAGNYAYVANSYDGLRVYDISNPANPINVGHTNTDSCAQQVALAGNYVCLANDLDGIRVYDISNPANPINVSRVKISGNGQAMGVAVSGNYVYGAQSLEGLCTYTLKIAQTHFLAADAGISAKQIITTGRLGIATTTPAKLLQVGGDLNTEGMMRFHSTSTNAGIYRYWDVGVPLGNQTVTGKNYSFVIDDPLLGSDPEFLINFQNGNVGIGTNGPVSKLHVNGNVTAAAFVGDGSGLTGLSAANITAGMLPDTALSINVTKLGQSIESTEITDGTLVNADLSPTAAISDAKLATISTAGKVADSALSTNVARRSGGNTFTGNQIIAGGGSLHFDNEVTIVAQNTSGIGENFLWPRWNDNVTYLNYGSGGFHIRNNSSTSTMFMQSNGNVGIGTTSPGRPLQIGGANGTEGMMRFRSVATAGGANRTWEVGVPMGEANTSGKFYSFVIDDTQLGSEPEFLVQYFTGNVGIGTTNPVAKLDVNGSVRATSFAGNAGSLTNLNASQLNSGTVPLARLPAALLTNGASGVNLSGTFSGNGAGLTNLNASQLTSGSLADARLSTNVALLNRTNQSFSGNNTFNQLGVQGNHSLEFGVGDLNRDPFEASIAYRFDSGGSGGLASSSLDIAGARVVGSDPRVVRIFDSLLVGNLLFVGGLNQNVGVKRFALDNAFEVEGNASKTTAGSWLANSDARIKQDIQPIEGALEKLNQVRLVSFQYTEQYRKDHPSIGTERYMNVVAQEFANVFPEHVRASSEKLPDGSKILQVDTYPLTIYSAAAVQELSRKLEKKDAEIANLQSRLEKLEQLLGNRLSGGNR